MIDVWKYTSRKAPSRWDAKVSPIPISVSRQSATRAGVILRDNMGVFHKHVHTVGQVTDQVLEADTRANCNT